MWCRWKQAECRVQNGGVVNNQSTSIWCSFPVFKRLLRSQVSVTDWAHVVNFLPSCRLRSSESLQHKVRPVLSGVSERCAKRDHRDRFMEVQNSWPAGKILFVTWTEQCVLTSHEQTSDWLLKLDFSKVFNSPVTHGEGSFCSGSLSVLFLCVFLFCLLTADTQKQGWHFSYWVIFFSPVVIKSKIRRWTFFDRSVRDNPTKQPKHFEFMPHFYDLCINC